MKILFTITYYLPNISGMSTYLKALGNKLSDKHNVTILTSKHQDNLPDVEIVNKNLCIKRVPVTFRVSKGVIMLRYFFRALREVKKHDVINCHIPQFESVLTAIASKIYKKRLVVTYHTELSWRGNWFNLLAVTVVNITQILTLLLADSIITHTEDYLNYSKILKYFRHKVKYILAPVDIEDYDKKYVDKKYKNFLNKYIGYKKIGFVGRIARQKGLQYLLLGAPEIRKHFKNKVLFIFVGPYNEVIGEKTYEELSPLINTIRNTAYFTGRVEPEQVSYYLNSFDLLVMPSDDSLESMPLAQIEALLHGIPVVAADLPGVRIPILRTHMGEISKIRDSKDLAKKIIMVLVNPSAYLKHINKAQAMFDINKIIFSYEQDFLGKTN